MSANVWFEEVNIGLINEIKNSVKTKDPHGVLTPLNDNAIVIRKPEEDFKFETFPCVSIYNKSYEFEPMRYNPHPVKVGEIVEEHIAIMEESAISFNLDYKIDFWSKYQTDMDIMTRTWLTKHFRQFNLKVTDDGGTERTCNCLIKGGVVKSDLVSGGERLFHSIINYQIWVELDEETRYNEYMSSQRNINLGETQ